MCIRDGGKASDEISVLFNSGDDRAEFWDSYIEGQDNPKFTHKGKESILWWSRPQTASQKTAAFALRKLREFFLTIATDFNKDDITINKGKANIVIDEEKIVAVRVDEDKTISFTWFSDPEGKLIVNKHNIMPNIAETYVQKKAKAAR